MFASICIVLNLQNWIILLPRSLFRNHFITPIFGMYLLGLLTEWPTFSQLFFETILDPSKIVLTFMGHYMSYCFSTVSYIFQTAANGSSLTGEMEVFGGIITYCILSRFWVSKSQKPCMSNGVLATILKSNSTHLHIHM